MRAHTLVVLMAIAVTVPVTGLQAPEPETPRTELQKFRRAIEEINAQAVNAGARLRNGAVSMGQGSDDNSGSPAQTCCASNIDKIGKQFTVMSTNIKNLRACYRTSGNSEAEVNLNFVHEDASSLYRAVGNFSNAKNTEELQIGYGVMARAMILLRNSAKKLTECEP